jgi:hypothetical protein
MAPVLSSEILEISLMLVLKYPRSVNSRMAVVIMWSFVSIVSHVRGYKPNGCSVYTILPFPCQGISSFNPFPQLQGSTGTLFTRWTTRARAAGAGYRP